MDAARAGGEFVPFFRQAFAAAYAFAIVGISNKKGAISENLASK